MRMRTVSCMKYALYVCALSADCGGKKEKGSAMETGEGSEGLRD